MPNTTVHPTARQRVKLQDTARLFRMEPDTVINRAGRRIAIRDGDGFIHAALRSLDGRVDMEAAYGGLPAAYRDSDPLDAMLDLVRQLDPLGLFEDAARLEADAGLLSDYDLGRWNRNLDFFNAYCTLADSKLAVQDRIKRARVVLLGLGGVGTHALLDLVSLGFVTIKAVDFDRVDLPNLNRQVLYGEADIGRRKIEAARETIERYIAAERHAITFDDTFIDGPDAAFALVEGADVVIGCVDRPTNVALWINEACVRARVPLVTGGVDTTRTCTYTVIPGRSGCVACWHRSAAAARPDDERLAIMELERDVMTLPPRPAPVHLVSVQVGFIMSEVLKIVTGLCPPSATDRLVEFDFATMATSVPETWTRDPGCPVCGDVAASGEA